MKDTELYQRILGLTSEWQVVDVDLNMEAGTVEVEVGHGGGATHCPECAQPMPIHDHANERRWRHLDTCQLQTFLRCRVPRVKCSEHGVKTVSVPWAEPHGRFTLMFEAVVIQWLQACMNQSAVAERLSLSFDQVNGIMKRAVERGLARREEAPMRQLGLDEKSMKRGHQYLTVLSDLEDGCVYDVAEGRKQTAAEGLLEELSEQQKQSVECVCMDMWRPFRQAAQKHLPHADVVHDRFHVCKHLNDAVDATRRKEQRLLLAAGEEGLKWTRYLFLTNFETLQEKHFATFNRALKVAKNTAACWQSKELFRDFWNQPTISHARTYLARWYKDARRKAIPALTKVAKMLLRHAAGLISYVHHRTTNSPAENLNGKIQQLKSTARGFWSFNNYRTNILFHFANLDLNPRKSQ